MRQWTAAKRENPDALLFSAWGFLKSCRFPVSKQATFPRKQIPIP